MFKLLINGEEKRKFNYMAEALAFAYQNGECYGALELKIVCADAVKGKPKKVEPQPKVTDTEVGDKDAKTEAEEITEEATSETSEETTEQEISDKPIEQVDDTSAAVSENTEVGDKDAKTETV